MARICVTGLWHQGPVLAGCFAELGHEVVGVADDPALVAALGAGRAALHEPGLGELLSAQTAAGRLSFTTDWTAAVRGADFVFLSVDTPVGPTDEPEPEVLFELAARIGAAASAESGVGAGEVLLVVTAQVPVGTTEALAAAVEGAGAALCRAVYVPEFLRLGTALESFRQADRFVVGADDAATGDRVASLYEPLGRPMVRMGVRSAEMTKHASNAFLALSISFINEIAELCGEAGADVAEVAAAMKLDPRIGPRAFLGAGLGFAGGTLGRDLRALEALGRSVGRPTRMAEAIMAVNAARPAMVRDLLAGLHGELAGLTVAVLGLTYKPGTSTLRRSVALEVIDGLVSAGASVRAHDPKADLSELDGPPRFEWCEDVESAVTGADAVVVVTAWPEFRALELAALRSRVRRPDLVDTQNLYDPAAVTAAGWSYYGVGRRGVAAAAVEEPA